MPLRRFLTVLVLLPAVLLAGAGLAAATPVHADATNSVEYWTADQQHADCGGSTNPSAMCYWRPSTSAKLGWFYRGCGLTRFTWSNGRTAWFVVGGGGNVYVIYQQSDWTWSDWYNFGGVAMSQVYINMPAIDRPIMSVAGTDANDWARKYTGSAWSGWSKYHVPGQYTDMC